ncbi:hypothetical protein [Coraliomargarita parva]|uniref:hypothetical protein n=1 Tax=Coraliomargarita parva TaxID=3014050 RepID=UPI0022B504C8|nr:hypothetical protein [Coraliomargarita parva]
MGTIRTVELNGEAMPLERGRASLAVNYLRAFQQALEGFREYQGFVQSLSALIEKDGYLLGLAHLSESPSRLHEPDYEALDEGETILAVSRKEGEAGYLSYRGRQDGAAFDAEDLHLMGALADFVSALLVQAGEYQRNRQAAKVLRYLIGQLPLAVLCFERDGSLILENKLAGRLLGDSGRATLAEHLSDLPAEADRCQLHFEIDGHFLYAEGRQLRIEEVELVMAFVVHDLTGSRERLYLSLERELYLDEARGTQLKLLLLNHTKKPGLIYGWMKARMDAFGLEARDLQAVDAYTCLCAFRHRSEQVLRTQLRASFEEGDLLSDLRLCLQPALIEPDGGAPGKAWLDQAESTMRRAQTALQPVVLLLCPHTGVVESVKLLLAGVARVELVADLDEVQSWMDAGRVDACVLDADAVDPGTLAAMHQALSASGTMTLQVYLSYRQPLMLSRELGLSPSPGILQKPFEAERLARLLHPVVNLS